MSGSREPQRPAAAVTQIEMLLRLALSRISIVVFEQDRELRYTRVFNPLPGFGSESVIGRRDDELLPADDAARLTAIKQRVLDSGEPAREVVRTTVAGVARYYDLSVEPLRSSADAVDGITCVAVDVTERRLADDALRSSEDRYRDLVEHSRDLIAVHDLDGRILSINEVVSRMTGYALARLHEMNMRDLLAPESRPRFDDYLAEMRRHGRASGRMKVRTAAGETRIWEYDNTLRTEGVAAPVVRATARDVTDRYLAERRLRQSEARYRRLFTAIPLPMWVYDVESLAILEVNDAAVAAYGYSRDEFLGLTIADIRPAEDIPRLKAHVKAATQLLEASGVWRHRRKDGSEIDVEIASHVFDYAGRRSRLVLARDVSEVRRAEEALRLRGAALDSAADAIALTDRKGTIQWVNPAFERLTGYSSAEAIGRNPRDLVRSGVQDRAFYEQLWETLRAGQVWRGELVNRRKDGSHYSEEMSITPVVDAAGETTHFVAIKRDLTDRQRLEAQLLQAQKMESLGRLAGGIAHDFNNLLTVINGTAELAATSLGPDDPLRGELAEIRQAGERAADLTRQLLAFSRQQILQLETLDLGELIRGLESMLGRLLGEDVELALLVDESVRVRADRGQLEQVVLNLAVNARDSMPRGGRLTISTRSVELAAGQIAAPTPLAAGTYALLEVRDTGVGIDEAVRAKIFDPFFTTKEIGKGTGLGLATVLGIAAQSGGGVAVESAPGEGTAFRVFLPAAASEPSTHDNRPTAAGAGGTETLLVVEDEPALRRLIDHVLAARGYRVLAADGGEAAVRLVDEHDGVIDLLITDVVMPAISGPELAERLAHRVPHERVLFVSGYTDDAVLRRGVLASTSHFLGKPFSGAALLAKVREILDAARGSASQ
jgi:two-component system, cell cycle sensor histidine kinase and response regulator CckA